MRNEHHRPQSNNYFVTPIMSSSQKVVVVTGASQGIGAEVVKAFRKLDYRVVATVIAAGKMAKGQDLGRYGLCRG